MLLILKILKTKFFLLKKNYLNIKKKFKVINKINSLSNVIISGVYLNAQNTTF